MRDESAADDSGRADTTYRGSGGGVWEDGVAQPFWERRLSGERHTPAGVGQDQETDMDGNAFVAAAACRTGGATSGRTARSTGCTTRGPRSRRILLILAASVLVIAGAALYLMSGRTEHGVPSPGLPQISSPSGEASRGNLWDPGTSGPIDGRPYVAPEAAPPVVPDANSGEPGAPRQQVIVRGGFIRDAACQTIAPELFVCCAATSPDVDGVSEPPALPLHRYTAASPLRADGRYAIPVPDSGFYQVLVGADGIRNAAVTYQASSLDARAPISAALALRLMIVAKPDQLPTDLDAEIVTPDGIQYVAAERSDGTEWSVPGPLLLPLRLRLRLAGRPNPVWWTIHTAESRLDLAGVVAEGPAVTIRMRNGGAALPGARITVSKASIRSGFLARDSEFLVETDIVGKATLPAGTLERIHVSHPDAAPRTVDADTLDLLGYVGGGPIEITMLAKSTPRGRLIRGPEPSAAFDSVGLLSTHSPRPLMTGRVDADGEFVLTTAPGASGAILHKLLYSEAAARTPGSLELAFRSRQEASGEMGFVVPVAVEALLDGSAMIQLPAAREMEGVELRNEGDFSPIAKGHVNLVPVVDGIPRNRESRSLGTTDLEGSVRRRFRLRGEWCLEASARGFLTTTIEVGAASTVDRRRCVIRMRPVATVLSARLVGPGGVPIQGLSLILEGERLPPIHRAVADDQGRVEFAMDSHDRFEYRVGTGPSYREASDNPPILDSRLPATEIRLVPAVARRLNIRRHDGSVPPDAWIVVTTPGEPRICVGEVPWSSSSSSITLGDESLELIVFSPGSAPGRIGWGGSSGSDQANVEVRLGEPLTLTVALREIAELGANPDLSLESVSRTTIPRADPPPAPTIKGEWDGTKSRFVLNGVEPGRWRVVIKDSEGLEKLSQVTEVATSSTLELSWPR